MNINENADNYINSSNLDEGTPIDQNNNISQGNPIINFLKSPTGEGSIESYIDSPLNFNNSKGLAQVLRGLTGLIGNLDFALIDVTMGTLNYFKEKSNVSV